MGFDDDKGKLIRANKRLSRELNRLERAFGAIKEGVLIFESDGNLRYSNRAAKNIFGVTEDADFINILKTIPELTTCSIDSKNQGTASSREFEISYPERRYVRVYSSSFDCNEEDSIILIISDITKEKISTDELIENERVASILKLSAGVAHELGNPLNSLGIHLQLARRKISKLSDESEREKLLESVDICSQELERLDGIIKNFLKAIRPIRPNLKELEALAPLLETIKFFESELDNLNIKVEIHSEKFLPSIMGDHDLLKQLYFNLIKNAMEAMDGGGAIVITANSTDSEIKIEIKDTGCGLNEDEIIRMFEPYFTTKLGGNGLGMMIASEIVKSHGGTIGVSGKENEGLSISLSFPRKDKRVRAIED